MFKTWGIAQPNWFSSWGIGIGTSDSPTFRSGSCANTLAHLFTAKFIHVVHSFHFDEARVYATWMNFEYNLWTTVASWPAFQDSGGNCHPMSQRLGKLAGGKNSSRDLLRAAKLDLDAYHSSFNEFPWSRLLIIQFWYVLGSKTHPYLTSVYLHVNPRRCQLFRFL